MTNETKIDTCFNCFESLKECVCGEAETFNNGAIACPHCGAYQDISDSPCSDYYEDGEFSMDCESCRKSFNVETSVSYSYTATRIEEHD